MAASLPKGIVYITKTKLVMYIQGSSAIYTLQFKPSYERDLEIINDDELDKEVKLFIETNKIPPAEIGFVLADSLLFEKKLDVAVINKDEEIKKYIEDIPFDDTSYQIVNIGVEAHVIVANVRFYTFLMEAFRPLGFTIVGVIPGKIVSSQFSAMEDIDINTAAFLSSKFTSYLGFNFVKPSIVNVEEEIGSVQPEKPKKSHEKELVIVFVLLLLIMVALYYFIYMRPAAKKKTIPRKAISHPTPTVILIPTSVPLIPSISEGVSPTSALPSPEVNPPQ